MMDPIIDQYAKNLPPDVTFVKIHAMYAPNALWMTQAKLFYTLQYLGKEEELHKNLFIEVQENGGVDEEGHKLAGLSDLDSMIKFAERNGISENDFRSAWNSTEVDNRMKLGLAFIENLNIDSVPAMAVNGKWSWTVMGGKTQGHFFETAQTVLAKERALLESQSAPDTTKASATP
jgi:thiol:disulfide interchange protein DsbA